MRKKLQFFKQEYKYYLRSKNVNHNSLKNYLSDVNNFISFVPSFDEIGIKTYLKHISKVPKSTKSRRLFTLKRFLSFLYENKYIFLDLSQFTNDSPKDDLSKMLKDYKNHLETNKASRNTIKNYISDVRHFLNYLSN